MMPKSLLRNELAVSALEDPDARQLRAGDRGDRRHPGARRYAASCSAAARLHADLLKERRKEALREVALVRIEQLYPFPSEEYQAILNHYPEAREVVWCEEEPQNQGAWYQIPSASPAGAGAVASGRCRAGRSPAATPGDRYRQDPRNRAADPGGGRAALDHHRGVRARDHPATAGSPRARCQHDPIEKEFMSTGNPCAAAAGIGR